MSTDEAEVTEGQKEFSERLGNLTMAEWRIIRKHSGFGMADLNEQVMGNEDFLVALVYVFKKKDDAGFKLTDAENLTFAQTLQALGLSD